MSSTRTKRREETIGDEKAERARTGARGSSGKGRLTDDALRLVRGTVVELFGDAVAGFTVDRLSWAEAGELAAFCQRIRIETKASPDAYFESAEAVERYATRMEQLAAETRGPDNQRKGELLAEFARTRQRTPNDAERDVILRQAKPDSTLATLTLPEQPPQVVSRGFRLGELDADERGRFEALIEKACDQPAAGIFEAERERRRFHAKIAGLAAKAAPGPRKRARPPVEQPGTIVLPAAVVSELLETTGETVALTVASLAVLTLVVGLIENRKLPFVNTHFGTARFTEDGDAIEVLRGQSLFGVANPSDRVDPAGWQEALGDLSRTRWLDVEPSGQWQRISYGPRMQDFLRGREETP